MLSTMRQSWLLFALFAIIALSAAMSIDEALHVDGIAEYLNVHGKRQDASGTGASEEPSETPTPSADSSTERTQETSATPTPSSNTPSDPTSQAPSSTPAPSSNTPTSQSSRPTSAGPSSTPPASTSSSSRPTATTPVVKTSALVSTSVQQYTTVITTQSNGQNVEITSTGESTFLSTTGTAVTTETPVPQNGGGGSDGGLTDNNKKIIGGVVGGVGGAILLGGIALVCWRIWGRKNRVAEDDDDLMAGTGSALGDKQSGSTANGSTPFQSNLEQYHNPGGRPNAAANF